MMQEKGHCKHGEYLLAEGCYQCEADRMGEEGNTEASIAEAVAVAKQIAERIFCTSEEGCEYQQGAYCVEGLPDCAFREVADRMGKGGNIVTSITEAIKKAKEVSETALPVPKVEIALAKSPGANVEVMRYYAESLGLLNYAEKRVITTAEHNKEATNDLSIIANLKKAMEEKKREYLDPLKAKADAIRETYNTLMDPIFRADKITKDKMLAYHQKQELIRLEQEAINQKRMEAAQAEQRLKGELSESVNLVEVKEETPKQVRTNLGTASMKDNWCFEVTDFALLPDEYKVADEVLLGQTARKHHDKKPVSGVRFYNKPVIAVRARIQKD